MAMCPSCNAPLKDGDWTCGTCGAPVAGAGMAGAHGGDYHAGYGGAHDTPADPARRSRCLERRLPAAARRGAGGEAGSSGTLGSSSSSPPSPSSPCSWSGSSLLRGPATTGEEFLGTWTATTQQGIATAVIAKKDDAFAVTLSGAQQGQKVQRPGAPRRHGARDHPG